MSTIKHTVLTTIACCGFAFTIGCGNSPSESTTPRGVAVLQPSETIGTTPAAPAPARAEAGSHSSGADQPASATAPRTAKRTASATATGPGLGVRRLAVATGVAGREPVGAGTSFASDTERLFAFVEATNPGGDETELVVTFESDAGEEVGFANVSVPAGVERWRTWAWSRNVHTPGAWTAVIRDTDGTELARQRFDVEG
jgi:hypothetical protein